MLPYLILSISLFVIGMLGMFSVRNHIIIISIAFELLSLAVNINFSVASIFLDDLMGQIYRLSVLTRAAAETSSGLALSIVYYRLRGGILWILLVCQKVNIIYAYISTTIEETLWQNKPKNRLRARAFDGAPHRKGIVYKIATMAPRKPNSAKRTFAKVRLNVNGKRIFAKIPGLGEHFLQTHSVVFVRGHGPKDSPGINYHLIRGLCDFVREETYGRKNRRSKFGLKKNKKD